MRYASTTAAPQKKGCCDGCDEAQSRGLVKPCGQAVVGLNELEAAKWFVDNRWTIIGASFAAGGLFFATVAYFVNRNP